MGAVLGATDHGVVLAMILLFVVHVVGMVVLIVHMGPGLKEMFSTSPYSDDDDWGEPPAGDPETPTPPTGGGLPLPGAAPSPNRLREPGRIGERYPKPSRRPAHAPPVRTPSRTP